MKKLISILLTPLYYLFFGLILLIFHPIQIICYRLFGYNAHKKSVSVLNYLLIQNLRVLGTTVKFSGFEKLPTDRPLIIVSNHQSMYDIPPVVWGFRKHHPKFISKKDLGKFLPSISYNLNKGGSALIDRKSRTQSIKEIAKLGQRIEKNTWSACIFPEGTRSKNGKLKKFKEAGIGTLLKFSPSALVVPFVINGNHKLQKYGYFPVSFGEKVEYKALNIINPEGKSPEEVTELAYSRIQDELLNSQ